MKYTLIITEEAKIEIASFSRADDKAGAKKVTPAQVNLSLCEATGPVIGLVVSIKKID